MEYNNNKIQINRPQINNAHIIHYMKRTPIARVLSEKYSWLQQLSIALFEN